MPFATTAAIVGGTLAAGIGGAAISSHAAGKAANTQAGAANYAADLQKQESDKALAFQQQQWDTQQKNMAPWLQTGQSALGQLHYLTKTPGQGLLTPFQAPDSVTMQNDPGYQERLKQGQQMLENSAAAHGGLLSGNTAQAEQKFGQDYASNEYSNVYNRAFNTFHSNQTDQFNRLAALSGVGQQTASTLGQQGQSAANNVGNIMLTTGAQQGQDAQNAAAARASGYVGGANAWSGGLSGGANNISQLMMMQQMFGGGGYNGNPYTFAGGG